MFVLGEYEALVLHTMCLIENKKRKKKGKRKVNLRWTFRIYEFYVLKMKVTYLQCGNKVLT